MNCLLKLIINLVPLKKLRHRLRSHFIEPQTTDGLKKAIAKLPFIPRVKDSLETVSFLCSGEHSLCRFGDGEFNLIKGHSIPFQEASPELSSRLLEVLQSRDAKIGVAINHPFWNYEKSSHEIVEYFHNTWVAEKLESITEMLEPDVTYYDSTFTSKHCANKSWDYAEYFSKCMNIWKGRDVVIICGETVFEKVSTRVFDQAKSLEMIKAPGNNAFKEYDSILKQAKRIDKDALVLILLGPTATVLAYDLAMDGYQAIDLGHLAKDYDCFLDGVHHSSETIVSFFDED